MAEPRGADALLEGLHSTYRHTYTARDVCLYALGVGAGAADLRYVYEGADGFAPLPTFFAIPAHPAIHAVPLSHHLPGCDMSRGLHAEQYIEFATDKLPADAEVVTSVEVMDAQSKGKGALVVVRTVTKDAHLGHTLAINEFTSFILGTKPFEGVKRPRARAAAATAANTPPQRAPDFVAEEPTTVDQAALYRLSGDLNPLHIDPEIAGFIGGFPRPILHGLCTMGISVRRVLQAFGGGDPTAVKSIKVRFSKHVFPGDTLRISMWADPSTNTVIFETSVDRRPGAVISNAAVTFHPGRMSPAPARPQAKL